MYKWQTLHKNNSAILVPHVESQIRMIKDNRCQLYEKCMFKEQMAKKLAHDIHICAFQAATICL